MLKVHYSSWKENNALGILCKFFWQEIGASGRQYVHRATEPRRVRNTSAKIHTAPLVKCRISVPCLSEVQLGTAIDTGRLIMHLVVILTSVLRLYGIATWRRQFVDDFLSDIRELGQRVSYVIISLDLIPASMKQRQDRQNYITEVYNLYCLPNMARGNKWTVI